MDTWNNKIINQNLQGAHGRIDNRPQCATIDLEAPIAHGLPNPCIRCTFLDLLIWYQKYVWGLLFWGVFKIYYLNCKRYMLSLSFWLQVGDLGILFCLQEGGLGLLFCLQEGGLGILFCLQEGGLRHCNLITRGMFYPYHSDYKEFLICLLF